MDLHWVGAILIIGGCGGVGFLMAMYERREHDTIRQLAAVLSYMISELSYRMSPLPELCRSSSRQCRGCLRALFIQLVNELESQLSPDVECCMRSAVGKVSELPEKTKEILNTMGSTLGRFDLQGQLRGLESLHDQCQNLNKAMEVNKDQRLRCYQTLGLCAGAALAILFL
jgi:stage III sporulation protein AB